MSAAGPGLLESGIDGDATAKKIHPFFAPQPRWRISKSTDRSKIALLRLPAEVRLLIYDHIMIINFSIDKKTVKRRNNTAARHQQWRSRAQITDAFNFMQTCKTVYNEAQQIFWGKNLFIIHANPPFGVWPRPDVRADDLWSQWNLTINCEWKITLGVESAKSQKMIRKLLWIFPKDPWYSSFGQWYESESASVKFNGSDIVPSNLTNVEEVCFFLDEKLSQKANYPTLDEVPGLIEEGILSPKVLPRLNSYSNRRRLRDAEIFTNATINTIQYLAGQVLLSTKMVSFVGSAHLSTIPMVVPDASKAAATRLSLLETN